METNPAYENILSRTSVRTFLDRPVADDLQDALLRAAMAAPSGVNRQPWEFIVIDDSKVLRELADALPYAKSAAHAPMAIAVCGNPERFLDGEDSTLWVQDLAAASENILLAANALGLGAVWTCIYPHRDRIDAATRILNLGDKLIPFNLIPVGYPKTQRQPMNKWAPDRIHRNRL